MTRLPGEIPPWRECPFEPGRAYRVRRSFVALRDSFTAGEVLTFDSDAWSRYHGITGYFFRQSGGGSLRVWDLEDDADVQDWRLFFDPLPVDSAP